MGHRVLPKLLPPALTLLRQVQGLYCRLYRECPPVARAPDCVFTARLLVLPRGLSREGRGRVLGLALAPFLP